MSKAQQASEHKRAKTARRPNKQLKAHRLKKNWTQVYVATLIGTSDVEVSRWETGATIPTLYFREQLCALFGATSEELGFASTSEPLTSQTQETTNTLWNVPYRRNPYFTGRQELLSRLHDALRSGTTRLIQVQAISGLGGIGKTQTALEYAYRHRDEYQAVFWIRADTGENLAADIASMAELLHLPAHQSRDQAQNIQATRHWLTTHNDWLLILDNVEALDQVQQWLTLEIGQVLVTTRSQVTGTFAQRLNLEKMAPEEGALFLLRRAKKLAPGMKLTEASATDQSIAIELSSTLDGLPLALDQVGAYIEETACSLLDYQEHYQRQRATLLARRGWMGSDHPHSVMTTLTMACIRVEQESPAALALLRLCAFLHPDSIPEELLIDGASALGPLLQSVAKDQLELDSAIAALRHYSLLQRDAENKTLTIHRLVQAVLKDRMSDEEQRQWAEQVVQMLALAVSAIKDVTGRVAWERSKRYLPHAHIGISLIETWKLQASEAEQLLHWMGEYINLLGQYAQAELLLQNALYLAIQSRGSEDTHVAEHMDELAVVYIYRGKYAQAEQLLHDALDIYTKSLEAEPISVAESLNNLGALYIRQGQYAQAEPLLSHSLTIQEKVLGNEHPNIAFPLTNLVWLYHHQGNYAQAEALNRRALSIREQALGASHFLVAHNLTLFGLTYREQGHLSASEPLLQQALHIREESLGMDHFTVGQSLHELATLYTHQGRLDEAASFFQRALAIREQQLGKDHPDTLATSNAYADLRRTMGKDIEVNIKQTHQEE